ncbi:Beta-galactosidase [Pseudobythopirellula maris]|uniref:Beta-galactosidase n=2 Tax=Pseudobythopirellula maris TaxID=2527991 RepID=A0A5C5ZTZ0_9BACT|nr:Beta-galactosidase [Pseudobythopirellula maris]
MITPLGHTLLALGGCLLAASFATAVEWEDQSVFRVNKEEPHATKMPWPDAESARSEPRMASPYCRLLNGEWKFHWSRRPEERPADFYTADFDDSAWGEIPVPSNVELEGHGVPIYANSEYPFKRDAPRVMGEPRRDWTSYEDRNPVSSYRKTFTLPNDWAGRRTRVVFNGVDSAFYLWCNGQKVGYSQDSRTPAEFDLTPYLQEGENLLAVEVYRFSDGSYLECQDFWRLSGIFRDVYLWSSATLDLRDFELSASLDDAYEKGVLSVQTWTKNHSDTASGYSVEARLLDGDQELARLGLMGEAAAGGEDVATASADSLDIEPWSAEKPRLYDLVLELKNSEGETTAVYSRKVGFRTSEIKEGQLLVNGEPVLIKGVNRHDHHHVTGHYVSEEAMREGLDQMKRLNVNAIRTSHYPNDPRFLELCDEYGFYVVSEANIETHGYGRSRNPLPKDMSWYEAHLDRVRNNVELHKNHACAVIWSMGNEAGDGPVFAKILEWLHDRDPSRPVQYENAHVSEHRPQTAVDIFAPMYFKVGRVQGYIDAEMQKAPEQRRPLIQCEYSHAMGNSCGGLKEYWDLVRRLPLYQGGFVWDWRDQGLLRHKTPEGGGEPIPYFAYGGDFGDKPNSNNFCMNGVVGADLTPNPHAWEVFHQYRHFLVEPVDVAAASSVRVRVTNEQFFTNAEGTPYRWVVTADGETVASGEDALPALEPQGSAELTIATGVSPNADKEHVLTIEFLQGAERSWGAADRVVAREQVMLPWGERRMDSYAAEGAVELDERDGVTARGDGFAVTFAPASGQMTSYRLAGKELLEGPLRLCFWRAPTDNDRGNRMPGRQGVWRTAGDHAEVESESVSVENGVARLQYKLRVPAGDTTARLVYTVHGDGAVEVAVRVSPRGERLAHLPRVGVQLQLDKSLGEWTWYGRGPHENYLDRNSGAWLGVHSGRVDDLWTRYSETQENSNRTGVRWASFTGEGGGARFESTDGQPLGVAAYPLALDDLEGEHRGVDLVERDFITVHVDHKQQGVAGEDSWGARPLRPYRLPARQAYEYRFRIVPTE